MLAFHYKLILCKNAFSECLADFGFKLFSMFIVDLLHEFELGVWKAIFTHLMHILFAAGGMAIQELNWRYGYYYFYAANSLVMFIC
jgi:hypothetical protein